MNKKRVFVYIAAMIVFFIFIGIRKKQVIAQRKSEPITFYGQWQKFGRPVISKRVFRKDIPLYEKLTLRPGTGGDFFGYAPRNIKKKLKPGQEIYSEWKGKKIYGKIEEIADKISFGSGMYKVKASFNRSAKRGDWLVSYVKVGILPKELSVPSSALIFENGEFYLWKIKDGKAKRTKVRVQRDGYGAIVKRGVSSGERIIYEGFTSLSDGDKIIEVDEDKLND